MTNGTNIVEEIQAHLRANGIVQISTYTKSTIYDKRHVDFFKTGSDGSPLVRHGRSFVDFRWCSVKFSKMQP